MEVTVTKSNFEQEVLNSDIPVLVDFWASWCGPCMMLSPIIEEIAKENAGKIKVCKINVDQEPELATEFGIMSIPTLYVFKNGEITANSLGYKPKDEILAMI